MSIKERIGIDLGRKVALEDGVAWAARHDVRYIDCEIDNEPNALLSFTDARHTLAWSRRRASTRSWPRLS